MILLLAKHFSGDKSRRMRWTRNVACTGEKRGVCRVLGGEDPGVDGRIILRWIFRKWGVGARTGSIWFRIGRGGGHLCKG
jgi:hypothetical protein